MNYVQQLVARDARLTKIRRDPYLLAAAKLHYKLNPNDFISDWLFTSDPRKSPSLLPFILFKRQQEYIEWLQQRWLAKEDGLVEKSRDMGLTWLSMAFAIWLWLFHDGVKIGFGSRKEDLVDRLDDPDSIFEKGRMILRYLPPEFLPTGFSMKNHAPHMKLINPANDSTIIGESGDQIGRGGRSSIYFKDESAFYERPMRIEAALSQNSDVKIDISTPNGEGNPFWRKRFGGAISVFTFHWRDDPRKDDAWYKKQCDTLDPITVAQEIDINYAAAIDNVCIPAHYVRAAVGLSLPAQGQKFAGLDVADEGADWNALISRTGVVVDYVTKWKEGNTTQTARKAYELAEELQVDHLNFDSIGVGAGVKGELWNLAEHGRVKVKVSGINVGEAPSNKRYTDEKPNDNLFTNLKAELWWKLRRRFERTYEHVNGIKAWPLDELISIPKNDELISELSRPLFEKNEAGKILIEPKSKMKRRGIASPNLADALILAFAPSKYREFVVI